MKTYIRATIFLVSLAAATLSAQQYASPVVQQPSQASSSTQPAASIESLLERVNGARGGTNGASPWEQASQAVFVVPSPDLPADSLLAISEDLAVMCRIFDKVVAPVQAAAVGSMSSYGGDPFDPYGGWPPSNRSRAQGLYLDGYGALFFVQVGFPLVAPAEELEKPKPEQPADPLWARTIDELQGSPQQSQPPAARPYDGQKVEDLKAVLIKSLRHASNLRIRGPQDVVAVVISTQVGSNYAFAYGTRQPAGTWTASDASNVLILRTNKTDVDAFAKGNLTAEQFTSKVQVLRSFTNNSPETIGSQNTGSNILTGPVLTVPSQNRR